MQSTVVRDDRRNLLATLTSKGEAVAGKATEANRSRLRAAFASLTPEELTTLSALLQRARQGFAVGAESAVSRG